MKELLVKKQEELQKSLQNLQQEFNKIQELILKYQGALEYNKILLDEISKE